MSIDLLKTTKDSKLIAVLDNSIKDKPAYYGAYGVAKAGLEQLIKTLNTTKLLPSSPTSISVKH